MYDITTLIDVEMQTLCSTFQKKICTIKII